MGDDLSLDVAHTPQRVAKMLLEESLSSYQPGALADLEARWKTFPADGRQAMVVMSPMAMASTCAHHCLPFFGDAHVGYIPGDEIVGLSKIPRVVDYFSHKLQTQERLTAEIANYLTEKLKPQAVIVLVEARHLCYDDETEILTDRGFVLFSSLSTNDRVAQADLRVDEISFVRPTKHVSYEYTGDMVRIGSKSTDLLVTPDHRCFLRRAWAHRQNSKSWGVEAASNVRPSDLVPLAAVYKGEHSAPRVRVAGRSWRSDVFASFLGAYLSEGWVSRRSNAVVITQYFASKGFDAYCRMLDSTPFTFRRNKIRKNGKVVGYQFKVHDSALNAYLRKFGKSGDVFVPNYIKRSSVANRKKFLRFYFLGDGWSHVKTRQVGYVTKSRRMADDLQEILVLVGRAATVTRRRNSGAYDVRVKCSGPRLEPKTTGRAGKISMEQYSGKVYCVTVPHGAVVVRRNGRVIISGNCMELRGVRKPGVVTRTAEVRGLAMTDDGIRTEFYRLIGR